MHNVNTLKQITPPVTIRLLVAMASRIPSRPIPQGRSIQCLHTATAWATWSLEDRSNLRYMARCTPRPLRRRNCRIAQMDTDERPHLDNTDPPGTRFG